MGTIGRQQQQQQGKGSGDTCCPDRAANIGAFPPKKSVISPMNFNRVTEWYLQEQQGAEPMSRRPRHSLMFVSTYTHSEAMKLHSEDERGTYSAIREDKAKT